MSRTDSARGNRSDGPTSSKTPRLTRREMDTSAHRLSRPQQRFGSKGTTIDKNETYAVTYFKNNPSATIDTRPPEEKLSELESQLEDCDLETADKFTILIHQKSLNYIVYGENSVEALRSHLALGQFYNENHRPLSALRHLQRAQQLQQTNDIERNEEIAIAVESAEAHLALRNDNRSESQKHIEQASEELDPVIDSEIDDPDLMYKRDLVKARVLCAKTKFDAALKQYEVALKSLDKANGGEESNVTAKLYAEVAETAEAAKEPEKAGDYFWKAYSTFLNLGMEESAAVIKPNVPCEKFDAY